MEENNAIFLLRKVLHRGRTALPGAKIVNEPNGVLFQRHCRAAGGDQDNRAIFAVCGRKKGWNTLEIKAHRRHAV